MICRASISKAAGKTLCLPGTVNWNGSVPAISQWLSRQLTVRTTRNSGVKKCRHVERMDSRLCSTIRQHSTCTDAAKHAHSSLQGGLEARVRTTIKELYPMAQLPATPVVSPSRHADYQTNVALLLSKQVLTSSKSGKKPSQQEIEKLAEIIASKIIAENTTDITIERSTVSAGFINLHISNSYLSRRLHQLLDAPYPILGQATLPLSSPPLSSPALSSPALSSPALSSPALSSPALPSPLRICVDFSSPNMGKELHVGHLRSSVIGDTIARMLAYMGHTVDRVSHVGDAGVPMALLLAAYDAVPVDEQPAWLRLPPEELLRIAQQVEKGEPVAGIALPTVTEFSQLYSESKLRVDRTTESTFAADVQSCLRDLQWVLQHAYDPSKEGFVETLSAFPTYDLGRLYARWKFICSISMGAIRPMLQLLNVSVSERGESHYMHQLSSVVEDLLARKIAIQTQGAIGVFTQGQDKPPFLLQKADGGYLYATIDMATLLYRLSRSYDRIIYITDVAQAGHFKQLFEAGVAAGWLDATHVTKLGDKRRQVRLEHAAFGVVTGVNGKKLSSRQGTEYTLRGLLDDGVTMVKSSMRDTFTGSELELQATAEQIAAGAVRYFDLAHNRKSNYEFSFDRVLSLKGNTAAYLLYASTRLSSLRSQATNARPHLEPCWDSIISDVKARLPRDMEPADAPWSAAERNLAVHLLRFPEAVQHAAEALLPNILTDYLHELATVFHVFYESCRVLPPDSATSGDYVNSCARLQLCKATEDTIGAGFSLIGLNPVRRM